MTVDVFLFSGCWMLVFLHSIYTSFPLRRRNSARISSTVVSIILILSLPASFPNGASSLRPRGARREWSNSMATYYSASCSGCARLSVDCSDRDGQCASTPALGLRSNTCG